VILGGFALALSYGAYVAEVYRAGINSVHRGQRDAALSVGLTETQTLRHVVVPQAVRNVGPPLLNDFIALQKDVALIAIIGVTGEAFRQAQIITAGTFNYTPLIAAALLYLCITIPLARLLDWWERRRDRR
jgi:polar amino acid transport system permease protein